LYKDAEVLKANPWFADALPIVQAARSRPVSPRYPEVADLMRKALNTVLARTKTPDVAAKEVITGLQAIYGK
jgi:multiple sugar transport system substrate-binding protein